MAPVTDPAVTAAAVARAEAANRAAHTAAQGGRRVPVLDTSDAFRAQLRAQRSAMPASVGAARIQTFPGRLERAGGVRLNGKQLDHVSGYATVYDRPYPMWDDFGPYSEYVAAGAADATLSRDPDVVFLMNHRGALMARTKALPGMAPTLELKTDRVGLFDDAFVNPTRPDVQILLSAIADGLMTEQSFAFMVVRGGWDEDFTVFAIDEFEIDRGDVSGVNLGANPYTSASARAQELVQLVDRMPATYATRTLEQLERRVDATRPRIEVGPVRRTSDEDAGSPAGRRIAGRIARTTARLGALAERGDGRISLGRTELPWYTMRDAGPGAPAGEPATVWVYEEIGGSFGVSAKQFAADLAEITAPTIRVRINSPGGAVRDGLAIMNSLIAHPARIETYVDGIAASAATLVALAGDEIVVMLGGQMMIHDASLVVEGNEEELAKAVTYIGRQSENIAALYAARSRMGGDAAYWRSLMRAETWAYGGEAVELGLADRVYEPTVAEPAVQCPDCGKMNTADAVECEHCSYPMPAKRAHDLSRFQYRYAGRANAPAPGSRLAVAGVPQQRADQGPVVAVPMGRSIRQLEAQLSLDGD